MGLDTRLADSKPILRKESADEVGTKRNLTAHLRILLYLNVQVLTAEVWQYRAARARCDVVSVGAIAMNDAEGSPSKLG